MSVTPFRTRGCSFGRLRGVTQKLYITTLRGLLVFLPMKFFLII